MNVQDLLNKLETKPLRSLADADHRQSPLSIKPSGVTVYLSEDECAYLKSLISNANAHYDH